MNNWNGIISLLIASLELIFLINLLIFAEKNKLNLLVISIMFLLFGYQAIEYFICGIGLSSSFMAYLAFVDITFLPPLNLLFVLSLFGNKSKLVPVIFLPAVVFVIYYSVIINEFDMLGIINVRIISKGRGGRMREIKLTLPESILEKSKEIVQSSLNYS